MSLTNAPTGLGVALGTGNGHYVHHGTFAPAEDDGRHLLGTRIPALLTMVVVLTSTAFAAQRQGRGLLTELRQLLTKPVQI